MQPKSNQGQKKQGAIGGFHKERTVAAKIQLGRPPKLDFTKPDPLIGETIMVIVADGSKTRSFTIHHPIGITGLDAGDWIISDSSDIPDLLDRRKDADASRMQQLRSRERQLLAVKAGLLTYNADTDVFTYPGGTERDGALASARTKQKLAGGTGGASAGGITAFLDEPAKAFEVAVEAFFKRDDVVLEVFKKYPDDYQTCAGPNRDRPQRSGTLGYKPGETELFDGLIFQIANMPLVSFGDAKNIYDHGQVLGVPNTSHVQQGEEAKPSTAASGPDPKGKKDGGKKGKGGNPLDIFRAKPKN